jgi:flavin reductase (DIM6/NTAB) family NADH-FMN oxidoreductase RutF
MERVPVAYDYSLSKTLALLERPGLLLVSSDRSGRSNVMTIGWATIGVIWGKPIFVAMVRPSRFTYGLIEDSGVFTVNVPAPDMTRWVGICGSRSGRDMDKFAAYEGGTSPAQTVPTITIDGSPLVYECRVVHTNDLIPANLEAEKDAQFYGGSDYHRLYYGEITGAYADTSAY